MKTQRYDTDESKYVLIEEVGDAVSDSARVRPSADQAGKGAKQQQAAGYWKVLAAEENVWKTQSRWATAGRFRLARKDALAQLDKAGGPRRRPTPPLPQQPHPQHQHKPELPAGVRSQRKISLASLDSLPHRISQFGKSLTIDSAARNNGSQ